MLEVLLALEQRIILEKGFKRDKQMNANSSCNLSSVDVSKDGEPTESSDKILHGDFRVGQEQCTEAADADGRTKDIASRKPIRILRGEPMPWVLFAAYSVVFCLF